MLRKFLSIFDILKIFAKIALFFSEIHEKQDGEVGDPVGPTVFGFCQYLVLKCSSEHQKRGLAQF